MKSTYHLPLTHAELDTILRRMTKGQQFTSPKFLMSQLIRAGYKQAVSTKDHREHIVPLHRKHIAVSLRRIGFTRYSTSAWERAGAKEKGSF